MATLCRDRVEFDFSREPVQCRPVMSMAGEFQGKMHGQTGAFQSSDRHGSANKALPTRYCVSRYRLVYSIDKLITETRRLAAEYRRSTGQALPVSGEIARHDAARLLGLKLCEPGTAGVDAIGTGSREGRRIQIKSRVMTQEKKSGARLGQLNTQGDWDTLLLVILDEDYEASEIYEATREELSDALAEAEHSNRTRRGALSVAKFKNIGWLVWARETGHEPLR